MLTNLFILVYSSDKFHVYSCQYNAFNNVFNSNTIHVHIKKHFITHYIFNNGAFIVWIKGDMYKFSNKMTLYTWRRFSEWVWLTFEIFVTTSLNVWDVKWALKQYTIQYLGILKNSRWDTRSGTRKSIGIIFYAREKIKRKKETKFHITEQNGTRAIDVREA